MDSSLPDLKSLTRNGVRIGVALLVIGVIIAAMGGVASGWGMPVPAQIALAILVVAAVLWISEVVPLFVTSFIILFLAIIWLEPAMKAGEVAISKGMFLAPFFSDIILLFLGGFVLSSALHKYQLDELLARLIIRRTGGSLPRLMLGVMLITALLSMFLSNTATAAMMLALVLPIAKGLPTGAPARKALILGIPLAANCGGLGTPIGSPPNAIAMQYMRDVGIAPSFGEWMLIGVPAALVVVVIAWLILLLIFRARGVVLDSSASGEPLKLTYTPGIGLVVAGSILTIIGWTTGEYHGLSSGTVSLIPLILFFGAGILNVRDLRGLSWDVLLVMGGGLCLGVAIDQSGLATWIIAQLDVNHLGVIGVMLVFGTLACLMSSVMSNTASANLILPIVLGLSIEPLSPILIAVAFCCSLAMALPISTPPNAMAFSSGEISVTDLLKPGLPLTLIGIALVFTVGYWWWGVVGIY